MKGVFKIISFLALGTLVMLQGSCTDKGKIVDQNTGIANHNWAYNNKVNTSVKIDDEKSPYNIYMNLRVTGDYKYSNLFVLITETGPDKKARVQRYELKLANKNGEWLGEGSGNFYSYELPFHTSYRFPVKGTYNFAIEQNMRDNPLKEVSDVGLRVERAN